MVLLKLERNLGLRNWGARSRSSEASSSHDRVLASVIRELSVVPGICPMVVLGLFMKFGTGVFTKDVAMIDVIHRGIPFVAGTQTINALASVFEGINFRTSDYTYSAYYMVGVVSMSIPSLVYIPAHKLFMGIWVALTICMSLETIASTRRPWLGLFDCPPQCTGRWNL